MGWGTLHPRFSTGVHFSRSGQTPLPTCVVWGLVFFLLFLGVWFGLVVSLCKLPRPEHFSFKVQPSSRQMRKTEGAGSERGLVSFLGTESKCLKVLPKAGSKGLLANVSTREWLLSTNDHSPTSLHITTSSQSPASDGKP